MYARTQRETLVKSTRTQYFIGAAVIGGLAFTTIATTAQAQADPAPTTIVSVQSQSARFSELANLPFPQGSASNETAQALKDELLFQRSTQAYLWAMPAIMSLGMQVGSEKAFGGGYNVLPIWKSLTDSKVLIVTPNTVTMYAVGYLDLGKEGALVVELPPMLIGFMSDFMAVPIPADGGVFAGDVGVNGPDGGKGGKYLLLPPGYKNAVPEGYYVYRSSMNSVMVTLRAFVADPSKIAETVAHLEKTRIYPLDSAIKAKPMVFPDASKPGLNMLPIEDGSAFDHLQRLIDREGDDFASPDWRGVLASIGIVKGQPFNPDARTRKILEQGAVTGFKTARVLANEVVVHGVSTLVYPDRRWTNPFPSGSSTKQLAINTAFLNASGHFLDLDSRAGYYSMSWGISPSMVKEATPGKGGFYAIATVDNEGEALSGNNNYRLHFPAGVPAKLFWSVTLYDAYTTSLLAGERLFPSLSSTEKPVQNNDGSMDLYFGPSAPSGKPGNWLPTKPGRNYIAILRLYGPTEAALDKSWKPSDLERVK